MIIRAATRDKLMVNVLGIDTSRIWTIGFMIGVSLAALAGALAAPMVAAVPEMGIEMTVECFVVVVIGGLGAWVAQYWVGCSSGKLSASFHCSLPNTPACQYSAEWRPFCCGGREGYSGRRAGYNAGDEGYARNIAATALAPCPQISAPPSG